MPNPHYNAGRRFEYEVMKVLKDAFGSESYTIIRTAGSHSPVDVILIKHIGESGRKRVFGVQCKTMKGKKRSINLKEYDGGEGLTHVPTE